MGIYISDDPARDFARHDAEQAAYEESLPHCDICGEPVDDFVFHIDDELLCYECLCRIYRRPVEDFLR